MDCDPGHDDMAALFIILLDARLELLGISSSLGNINAKQTAINALNILKIFGKDKSIKVFQGSETPFKRSKFEEDYFHG